MVLIDDNPLAPVGIVALIRAQPGFQVLTASAGIKEALRRVRRKRPDVVLVNAQRHVNDDLTLATALHAQVPESRVIIMGLEPLQEDVAGFVRAGVSGFVMTGATFDTFQSTIHSVAQGTQVLPSELTRSLFDQLTGRRVPRPRKRILALPKRLEVAAFSRQSGSRDGSEPAGSRPRGKA